MSFADLPNFHELTSDNFVGNISIRKACGIDDSGDGSWISFTQPMVNYNPSNGVATVSTNIGYNSGYNHYIAEYTLYITCIYCE